MNQQLRNALLITLPLIPRTEQEEQETYFGWLRLQHNRLPGLRFVFHCTNEGKRSWAGGKALQRAGLVRGVLDVICMSSAHPFAIEMKVSDNEPTPEQTWFLSAMHHDGTPVALAYNAQEAIDFTEACCTGDHRDTLAFKRAMLWLSHAVRMGIEESPYDPKPSKRLQRAW